MLLKIKHVLGGNKDWKCIIGISQLYYMDTEVFFLGNRERELVAFLYETCLLLATVKLSSIVSYR